MIKINHSKKINEIEETFRKLKRRILTLIGKIVVVKKTAYFKAQPFVFNPSKSIRS